MDTFFLEALTRELQDKISGARIDKIHQPAAQTLVLRLWNGREELRLLLSPDPGAPRLLLTEATYANPPAPPRFCQLARSRLARIETVEKLPEERILHFRCRGRRGDRYLLILELLGKHADLILIDDRGVIVDSLRRQESADRDLQPGSVYRRPSPPGRLFLAAGTPPVPPEALGPAPFRRWLQAEVVPMSPLVAGALAAEVEAGEDPSSVLDRFRRNWLAGNFRPAVALVEGRPLLLAFDLHGLSPKDVRTFDSPSRAAEFFFDRQAEEGAGREGEAELRGILRREGRRLARRLENLQAEGERLAAADEERRQGELLLANLHRVRRGMTEVTLENFYAEPPQPLTVRLEPQLSPQENAQKFFRRYTKAKNGAEHLRRRQLETGEELHWLDGVALALEEAETPEDLMAVRLELEQAGLLTPPAARGGRRRSAPPGIRQARTPGGFRILWGRSNLGNDRISRELTAPDDPWFHAQGVPGAHLVLKREPGKDEVPEADLLYAAAVAAGYSRAKEAAKVEVMVTEGKWVRRPKGARPGLVTVERYRTVMVRPIRVEDASPGAGE